MAKPILDRTGKQYGRLTAVSYKGNRKWLCVCDCGNSKIIDGRELTAHKTRSCGCLLKDFYAGRCARTGKFSTNWKGGKIENQGYTKTNIPGRGYIFDHRLVAEKIIGRRLRSNETVHHKNGIRKDNRPENLELWCKSQPAGQRVEDLIRYAKEILVQYEPSALSENALSDCRQQVLPE